jgi:hypothetical protein
MDSRRLPAAYGVIILGLLLVAAVLSPPVRAEIPFLTWDDPVVVDSPVAQVSTSTGVSVVYWNAQWWVVYEKAGDIYACSNSGNVWSAPIPLATGPASAQAPHLSEVGEGLTVVWQDDRTGHTEVWSRRLTGTTWDPEECLTPDAIASVAPVIAGNYLGGVVAWEEGGEHIYGRVWQNDTWSAAQNISGAQRAMLPSVAVSSMETGVPGELTFFVAWTDLRTHFMQIYLRAWSHSYPCNGWCPEQAVTNYPFDCFAPSIQSYVLSDGVWSDEVAVTFGSYGAMPWEYDVWAAEVDWQAIQATVRRITPPDRTDSIDPNLTVFPYRYAWNCDCGLTMPGYFFTWTDRLPDGSRVHLVGDRGLSPERTAVLSESGLATSVIGAKTDPATPFEDVMAMYIEMRDGAPALVARRGMTQSCQWLAMDCPPALLLAPGGLPDWGIRAYDSCGFALPPEGFSVRIGFDTNLAAALTWDAGQPHPVVEAITDENGMARFTIRGGGCSQAGEARTLCSHSDAGWPLYIWGGAKSPDVNGDCVVGQDDLDYVESRAGTADFCADLDGSGLVDDADVALAQATLGDICPSIVGASDTGAPPAFALSAGPNPAREQVQFTLSMPADGKTEVRVVDAGGRLVRALAAGPMSRGVTRIPWDLRDQTGRRVPSGIYFAVATSDGRKEARVIVISR